MEYDFKRAPFQSKRARWALLISCDMPQLHQSNSASQKAFSSSLELVLADGVTTFTQPISLRPSTVDLVPPEGSLGICIAPLYGPINDSKTLQWRIHHALLGVKTVHWYDRDGRGRTREWVKELNRQFGLKDTYNDAPCISPESCGKEEVLEDKGVSGDQVLYYADCLARSRHTHPTEWLAMIDIDEYLFPTSDQASLSTFLSSQDPTTAALAFERYFAPADPLLPIEADLSASSPSPNLILDKIKTLATPLEVDRHDNTKMIYRSESLKLAWVHWEVAFRSDSPAQAKVK
ncbi:hypothetical protein P389DRAFT_39288 [Cystobasidium minutum MCA 4210]|uniref:uncharacterized protein n=1 Tax=Cystobasidium minutum MCA 4210 TaxID=1397322 RepID=UPI0034CF9543|eukprot:jgi/Rhomi1/39288/CE39287_266